MTSDAIMEEIRGGGAAKGAPLPIATINGDAGGLTILRPVDHRRLATKEYVVGADGRVMRREFGEAATFSAELVTVDGIAELHRLLAELEADPHAFVIRGAPKATTDLQRTARTLRKGGGAFADTPRSWVMIDADKVPLPTGYSVIADPEDVARHLLDLFAGFAPELEGATAIVQFSSSAGIGEMAEAEQAAGLPGRWGTLAKRDHVSAHLWFWLETPQDGAALDRWAKAVNAEAGHKAIDPATMNAIQAHYTAAPVFGAGLRDPLQGRRTLLIKGSADTVTLEIPAEAPRPSYSGATAGGSSLVGLGFTQRLELIGHPEHGFHGPINGAIASYVASNWPDPDTDTLVRLLQARILAADPGGRSRSEIDRYADAGNLQARIAWTCDRQREKAEAEQAQRAAAEAVEPTFPDRGVELVEGQRLAAAAVDRFADRLRAGEAPEMLLRVTVGAGKTEAVVKHAVTLLEAAREGGGDLAAGHGLIVLVPRHDLGGEIVRRLAAEHPGKAIATWRGMDADDPERPGAKMCLDPALPKAAGEAGQAAAIVCGACPLNGTCGYRRQRSQRADIWIAAHQLAFQDKPKPLPEAGVVVIDEAFWPAALVGQDGTTPPQLALSALEDLRTVPMAPQDRERLMYLRDKARRVLLAHEAGGVRREAFVEAGMTADMAREWVTLEWLQKPHVQLAEGMAREAIVERLRDAAELGFTRLRPLLAQYVAELLESDAARSVNISFTPDAALGRNQGTGPAVRFAWRQDFSGWITASPKLFLDATTAPEVLRAWAPKIEVVDIEFKTPKQHVRQVIGKEFSRASFTQTPANVGRLADLVVVELAKAGGGDVLVVAQKAVEDLLRDELQRRFEDVLPDRLHLAHHGAVTGMDQWRDVSRVVVVGRPAVNLLAGERLGEIAAGAPVRRVQDGDRAFWPVVQAGIRRPDGSGTAVQQPRHPDPLVEALRWSLTEGAVIQAIGRARGVRRAEPVHVTLLCSLALPLTVQEVTTWEDALPDRLMVALAEAALTGRALPLAPADLATARPDLWRTPKAAARFFEEQGETPQTLIDITYKGSGGFARLARARYRKGAGGGRWSLALVPPVGGRAALEKLLDTPLAAFTMEDALPPPLPAAEAPPPRPAAPEPPAQAALDPLAIEPARWFSKARRPRKPVLPVVALFTIRTPLGPTEIEQAGFMDLDHDARPGASWRAWCSLPHRPPGIAGLGAMT